MRGKLSAAIGACFVAACGTLLGVTSDGPAEAPVPEAGSEAGPDAGVDAPLDAGLDAAPDAAVDGDLPAAEAGSIACGDHACEAVQQFCCYDGGAAPSCSMDVSDTCTLELDCDQSADCVVPGPCVLRAGDTTANCAPSVPDDAGTLCGDEGDCTGTKCVVTTCRGIRMRLCDGYCPP